MKRKLLKMFFGLSFYLACYATYGQTPAVCTLSQGNSDRTDSVQMYIGANINSDSVIVFYRYDSAVRVNPILNTTYQVGDTLLDGAKCIYKGLPDVFVSLPVQTMGDIVFFKAHSFKTTEASEVSTLRYSNGVAYIGRTALNAPWCFNAATEPQLMGGSPLIGWGKATEKPLMIGALNLPAPANYCVSAQNGRVLYNNLNNIEEGFSAISPYILFKDTNKLKRVHIDINSFAYMPGKGGAVTITGLNRPFSEEDTVLVDISEDGLTWERIHVFTKDSVKFNPDGIDVPFSFSFKSQSLTLKFRFSVKAANNGMICLSDICIEESQSGFEQKKCVFPVQIKVLEDEIGLNSALIEWTDINRFDAEYCIVRYADTSVKTNENPFLLSGLRPGTTYEVSMRSQCSSKASDSSNYNPFPVFFQTVGELPYLPNFNNYAQKCNSSAAYIPSWKRYSYKIIDSALTKNMKAIEDHVNTGSSIQLNISDSESVHYTVSSFPAGSFNQFLTSPAVKLSGKSKLHIDIDMFFATYGGSLNTLDNGVIYILYSKDGGISWKKSDTLAVYGSGYRNQEDLLDTENSLRTYSLEGIEDISELAIGIYTEAPAVKKSFQLKIRHLEVKKACQTPISVKVSDIRADSAKIVYEGSSSVGLLTYWKTSDENTMYSLPMENRSLRIGGLEEQTEYTFNVRGICAEDTSDYIVGSFTSFVSLCETPTNLKAGANQYKAVSIKWQGTADAYNLVWQRDLDEKWDTIKGIKDTAYTLTGLTYNAKYWIKIQSDCGKKQSEFTKEKAFYTSYLDCEKPAELSVASLSTPVRVYINWKNSASAYEARWKKAGDQIWTEKYLISNQIDFPTMPETTYKIQIRGLCLTIDTTEWSDTLSFTTKELDECQMPVKLSAEQITEENALLKWETSSPNYMIQFYGRKQGEEEFSEKINLSMRTEYLWEFLEKSTTYEWKIRSICYSMDTTEWSPLKSFKTEGVAIEDNSKDESLLVYSKNGKIIIQNLVEQRISLIEVLNIQGQRIYTSSTQTQNPTEIGGIQERGLVFVRITLNGDYLRTYKVSLW